MARGSIHFVRFAREYQTSLVYCSFNFLQTLLIVAVFSQTDKSCIKSLGKYSLYSSTSIIDSTNFFQVDIFIEILLNKSSYTKLLVDFQTKPNAFIIGTHEFRRFHNIDDEEAIM
jgi:hypothetical protein